MLEIKNINLKYAKVIYEHAHIQFYHSCIHAITGPSGCGKTSFFRLLLSENEMDIYEDGKLIQDKNMFIKNRVFYVSQTGEYFPNMTIKQHFQFFAKMGDEDVNEKRIEDCLSRVNLKNISLKSYPHVLSIGERKRFLIALALFCHKDILILDEPTASLDKKNIEILKNVLTSLKDMTIIMSTHDQGLLDICDVVYTIHNHQFQCLQNQGIDQIHHKKMTIFHFCPFYYWHLKSPMQWVQSFIVLLLGGFILFQVFFTSYTIIDQKDMNPTVINTASKSMIYLRQRKGDADILYVPGVDQNRAIPLTTKQLQQIQNIKGVQSIYPTDVLSSYNGEEENGFTIKRDKEKHVYKDKQVLIIPYYSNYHLENDIYCSQAFQELMNMKGCTMTSSVYIPVKQYVYNQEEHENEYKYITYTKKELSFHIHGVINQNQEIVSSLSDYVICVPIEKMKNIYHEVENTNQIERSYYLELVEKQYQATNYQMSDYVIFVDEDKTEKVYKQLLNMDTQFDVSNTYMNYLEINQLVDEYLKNQVLSLGLIVSVSICAFFIVCIFYMRSHKQEVKLLRQNGITSQDIHHFFCLEQIFYFLLWFAFGVIVDFVYSYIYQTHYEMKLLIVNLGCALFITLLWRGVTKMLIRKEGYYDLL